MSTKTTITKAEQAERAEAIRQIRHSTEMEGGQSSDAARADQDAYVRGELAVEELVKRAKARYGI